MMVPRIDPTQVGVLLIDVQPDTLSKEIKND